jgi:transcriptional regulator with XRE-family HTH domain
LRKKGEITQASLADKLDISERRLRDIEKKDHPVPATIITALAAELKVSLSEITLSIPDAPTSKTGPLLKLRAVRSATELSGLAKSASEYDWWLQIDPTTATAADMQAVMKIVHRFVRKLGRECQYSVWGDDFDLDTFGEIPRLAFLHDLLTRLRTNGVNVIAGTYSRSRLRELEQDGDIPGVDEIYVRVPGTTIEKAFKTELVLKISFVPSDVEEKVVQIYTGPSLENFERVVDDEIPF